MGLRKLAEKLSDYNARLEMGKAEKIKPRHVQKVLEKLRKKARQLEAEVAGTHHPDKKARLTKKLEIAQQHVARAEWLLTQLD